MSRRNPFDELERLFDRMSRQFDQDVGDLPALGGGGPAVDVADHDDEVVVTVDLPGYDREDIDVRLVDDSLRVSAHRETSTDEDTGQYVRRERRREHASRTISLPEPVDEDGVSATYSNGVLTVTLPKARGGDTGHSIDVE